MPLPSVTHTFVAGTTIEAGQVNTNFSDLINDLTDGTADLTVNSLTLTSTLSIGGNVTLSGNVVGNIIPNADATYTLADATNGFVALYLDNTATDGGTVYFDGSNTSYLQSSADGTTLTAEGFTSVVLDDASLSLDSGTSTLTIGDGTGTGTTPDLTVNKDSGDATIRLQVNNDSANAWDLSVDNDSSDRLRHRYNGTTRMDIETDGRTNISDGTDTISIIPTNIASSTAPQHNGIYANSIIKAWASFNVGGSGTVTVADGFNISSASYSGNILTVNFATSLTNTSYAVSIMASGGGGFTHDEEVYINFRNTGNVQLGLRDSGGSENWSNGDNFTFIVVGD